ncbi:universal stress protein [Methanovulcanius yangii]|uniref:universal stress protein n=1 Tax=Methanovulcanius yangii TaxID=1789227 RepID=UPI0029CA609E|nr:universal stress protein [Methanovulcanius yangii]
MKFRRLLVAYDGSDFSRAALQTALDNAGFWGSEIYAIYVVDPGALTPTIVDPQIGVADPNTLRRLEVIEKEGDVILGEAEKMAQDAGMELKGTMLIGDPKDEILDYAKEIEADLIILGSAGKGWTRRFILGSVSSSVVANSPVSTLVIHKQKKEE